MIYAKVQINFEKEQFKILVVISPDFVGNVKMIFDYNFRKMIFDYNFRAPLNLPK